MLKRFLIFTVFLHYFSNLAWSEEAPCDDLLKTEVLHFLSDGGEEVIPKLYSLVLLKLLREVRFESHSTLEDWLKQQTVEIESSQETLLENLNQLYERYQYSTDLIELDEQIQLSSPWSASLRLRENQISQYILTQTILDPEGPWSETDAATVWLVSYLLENAQEIAPIGSAQYNQIALSTSIIRIGERTQASGFEVNEWINQQQQSIESDLIIFIENFLEKHHEQCAQWFFNHHCLNGRIDLQDLVPATFRNLQQITNEVLAELSGSRLKLQMNNGIKLSLSPLNPTLEAHHRLLQPRAPELILANLPSGVTLSPTEIQVQALRHLEDEFNAIESEESKIHIFHGDLNQINNQKIYAILDRSKPSISFYRKGQRIQDFQLDPSQQFQSDEHRHGGAGLYQFAYFSNQSSQFFITDQKNRNTGFSLAFKEDREQLQALLNESPLVYVLPIEEDNSFRLKDGQLQFTPDRRRSDTRDYNFSPRRLVYRQVQTIISDQKLNTLFNQDFISTLDREKATLMRLYDLDNDDYNELVRMSFGILGNESNFSTSSKYWIKESFPWLVSLLKGEGLDTSSNSRGPTQIKTVPQLIREHYGVSKSTLHRAEHAAVATLGFLAQSLQELKNRERHHPDITPYNRLDYLHYIYMGRSSEISRGSATPERNIYYRQMREIADSLVQREIIPGP